MTFVVHASTPEDLRSELLEWLKTKHLDALHRAGVRNQSRKIAFAWAVRAEVITEAAAFIKDLKIEPKEPIPFTDGSLPNDLLDNI